MSANFSKTVLDRLACSGAEVSSLHGYESDIYIPGEVGGTGGSLKPIAMAKMGTSCGCMGWKSDPVVGGSLKLSNLQGW